MDESPPFVDGVQEHSPSNPSFTEGKSSSVLKRKLLIYLGILYGIFVFLSGVILVAFPSQNPDIQRFFWLGIILALIETACFLAIGTLLARRILTLKNISVPARKRALIRVGFIALPGIFLGVILLMSTLREPGLFIAISAPQGPLLAPTSITFDLSRSFEILRERGNQPVSVAWDFTGDGKVDRTSPESQATAFYDREGTYTVAAQIRLINGEVRNGSRRFTIPRAVFSVSPFPPPLGKSARLSVERLVEDPKQVRQILWDFDGDGTPDMKTRSLSVEHTFFREGEIPVSVTIQFENQSEVRYDRILQVQEPVPPPFPVELISEPEYLIGSPPFTAIFRIESSEAFRQVLWTFGDGAEDTGTRVAHTFERNGLFPVSARVVSEDGEIAMLSASVEVVNPLRLSDLRFTGTPKVQQNKITGEAPLAIDIEPKTETSFVEFFWEVPSVAEVQSAEGRLQILIRDEGIYTVTLVATHPEGKTLRLPLTVEVKGVSALVSFRMEPEGGNAPLSVTFDASRTDIPGADIAGFEWKFGDGSPSQIAGAQVIHIYNQEGSYTVELVVQTVEGKEHSLQRTLVVFPGSITAEICPSRTNVSLSSSNRAVVFFEPCTDEGEDATYLWDFGDGAQSDVQSLPHAFTDPGTYTVRLVVEKDGKRTANTVSIAVTP